MREDGEFRQFLGGCGCFLGVIYAFTILVLLFIGLSEPESEGLYNPHSALVAAVALVLLGVPFLGVNRLRPLGAVLFLAFLLFVLAATAGFFGFFIPVD